MNLKHILLGASILAAVSTVNANSVSLYDDSFSFFNGNTEITSGTYNVLWGTYSSGSFTPLLGVAPSDDNSGYMDISGINQELTATLAQSNNNNIAAGAQLALAITLQADNTNYDPLPLKVVLTDPTWVAPTFVFLSDPIISVELTNSTTALSGVYSYNGGNEILSTVPEPSTFAALAGVSVLGLAALRRRRA